MLIDMVTIRDLRASVDMTQAELASAGGTSQPTVAAYEVGSKSPTLRTLERLASSVGRDAVVVYVAPLTREDRRSLALHHAIARRLRAQPDEVLAVASQNLNRMARRHVGATPLLDEWRRVLERPIEAIIEVMVDPGVHARDLRQVTPFAGVLTATERAAVYRRFSEGEKQR